MNDSVQLLRTRCETIADGFADVPAFDLNSLQGLPRVACCGLGLAGATASFARAVFAELGWNARNFAPSECFDAPEQATHETLVVFSQNISPNAQILMSQQPRFARSVLVTSAQTGPLLSSWATHGTVQTIPPSEPEIGLLVRVLGPAYAAYSLVLAASEKLGWNLDGFPDKYREMFQHGLDLGKNHASTISAGALGIVTTSNLHDFVLPLQWKLLEALWHPILPSVDAINFVHGPMQALYGTSNHLFFLGRNSQTHTELANRLSRINGGGQTHVVLSDEPAMVATLLYDGFFNGLICAVLEQSDHDLSRWPGKGEDGPIYGITTSSFFEN